MNMEIHEQLKEVYSETCMSLMMVGKCVKQFTEGRINHEAVTRCQITCCQTVVHWAANCEHLLTQLFRNKLWIYMTNQWKWMHSFFNSANGNTATETNASSTWISNQPNLLSHNFNDHKWLYSDGTHILHETVFWNKTICKNLEGFLL